MDESESDIEQTVQHTGSLFYKNSEGEKLPPLEVSLNIEDTSERFQLDTGASVSLMSEQFYATWTLKNRPKIQKSKTILQTYTKQNVEPKGGCYVTAIYQVYQVVPLGPENDAEDHDDKKNDEDDLVQISKTAQVTPTTAIVGIEHEELCRHARKAALRELICQNIKPINCQEVKSSPLIGQKGKRRVKRVRPSTFYPADRSVSRGYSLYYHRFVNDDSENESCDEESSDDDDYMDDADIESDVDENDDRITLLYMVINGHKCKCGF